MKNWIYIFFAIFVILPWIIVKFFFSYQPSVFIGLLSGLAIVGSAFLLTWACEVSQLDISQSFAIAILALIAVLPEYAVDIYFAWTAAKNPQYISYAAANMTGGNRLLIGFGWASVVIIYFLKYKKNQVELEQSTGVAIFYLKLATLYSFFIPLKRNISLIDTVIFFTIFIFYVKALLREEVKEPEIIGPAEAIAQLKPLIRRIVVILFFIFSAFCIFISAKPFAESLIHTGKILNIEEFLLVQWLAPLASESPEFIVAILFTLKNRPSQGLGTLISSKVNQWTLLIGMLPLAFSISAMNISHLPLDFRQTEEVLLTAAQSLFALSIIINYKVSMLEAMLLLILFFTQLFFTNPSIRYVYSGIYIVLGIILIIKDGKGFFRMHKNK